MLDIKLRRDDWVLDRGDIKAKRPEGDTFVSVNTTLTHAIKYIGEELAGIELAHYLYSDDVYTVFKAPTVQTSLYKDSARFYETYSALFLVNCESVFYVLENKLNPSIRLVYDVSDSFY